MNQVFESFITTNKNKNQLSNSFEVFIFTTRILQSSKLYENQDTFINISKEIASLLVQEFANRYFEYKITTIIIEIK
jgi:hypothetical protein